MITFTRCDSSNAEFVKLTNCLDAALSERNGKSQEEYNQYNHIDHISTVIIAMENEVPVGCGCFKEYQNQVVEMKRIYVNPDHRAKGIAKQLMEQLEFWAIALGYHKAVLETGLQQFEAIHLYEKCGYLKSENYGQYVGMKNSVCFSKILNCAK